MQRSFFASGSQPSSYRWQDNAASLVNDDPPRPVTAESTPVVRPVQICESARANLMRRLRHPGVVGGPGARSSRRALRAAAAAADRVLGGVAAVGCAAG